MCKYVLYYCHRVSTWLHLTNISYHISCRIVSYRTVSIVSYRIVLYLIVSYCIYHIVSYLILSYCIVSYCIVLYLSYRIVSYCIVSYRVVSYSTVFIVSYPTVSIVSYRTVSYHIVLYLSYRIVLYLSYHISYQYCRFFGDFSTLMQCSIRVIFSTIQWVIFFHNQIAFTLIFFLSFPFYNPHIT